LKISIICSVFNNKETIAEAIESVLGQTYANIELIVIDGSSTDGTLDVIRTYQERIAILVSEPDNGIYDGLNKGISCATGDVIGFLHSDDLYQDDRVIERVAQAFGEFDVDSVYGDLLYVSKEAPEKVIRYWKSGAFKPAKLRRGWMPPHPTLFIRRSVYRQYGLFDTRFSIAADYDLILRFLGKQGISTHYIPTVFIKMRMGGKSNSNLSNVLRKSYEDLRVLRNNEIGGISTLFLKNICKIPQFFSKTID